ncbi:hypothetical protein ACJQ40_002877 [Enterococcus faecium]
MSLRKKLIFIVTVVCSVSILGLGYLKTEKEQKIEKNLYETVLVKDISKEVANSERLINNLYVDDSAGFLKSGLNEEQIKEITNNLSYSEKILNSISIYKKQTKLVSTLSEQKKKIENVRIKLMIQDDLSALFTPNIIDWSKEEGEHQVIVPVNGQKVNEINEMLDSLKKDDRDSDWKAVILSYLGRIEDITKYE